MLFKKITTYILLLILVFFAFILLRFSNKPHLNNNAPQACTLEAKVCPDGSAVGRSGPNCEFAPCPDTNQNTNLELDTIFEIDKKEPGTKIYYSEKLAIGFTYLNYNDKKPVVITEKNNKVSVDDQSIEVFTKDSVLSLEQAIEDRFLQAYDQKDCFVKILTNTEQNLSNYVMATISYPQASNPEDPWWKNSEKCPQNYSATNGIQYFLMNKDVPDRFLFIKVGQYSAASDGTPNTETGGSNWTHSIRILPLKNNLGLANPASQNCLAKGGRLDMRENKVGNYGVCLFEDNRQCEEWALFRGECPLGGLKITGYENEAQIYCVITGGQVEGLGTKSVLCKRIDGTYCEINANFNGDCPNPNNPNPNASNTEAL